MNVPTDADLRRIVLDCDDRCADPGEHYHFTGKPFRWCRPILDLGLRAADPITKVVPNRYPHNLIGVAVYVRGRGMGVRWKRSPAGRRVPLRGGDPLEATAHDGGGERSMVWRCRIGHPGLCNGCDDSFPCGWADAARPEAGNG